MNPGFLSLITHPEHPGLVRTQTQDSLPELIPCEDGGEIRYLARFQDIDAALMHVQNMMHTALVDLENRIYQKPLEEMIACVEADVLEHSRVWIDPALTPEQQAHIDTMTERLKSSRRRIDRIWQVVGLLGVLLLLLLSLKL
ncbi:MAG: hypothetical protein P8166_04540 [Candidatus Thiodiazotropha sp.]|jgi:hypothetical protein